MSQHSIAFFENQFQRQVSQGEFALNPFEQLALHHLKGEVLDLGCGLGNLALEAARRGCHVTALDGSSTAIARIREAALNENLPLEAHTANLTQHVIEREYDTIVCIGLLMFFRENQARSVLADMLQHVRPGGCLVLNILVEGTTFLGMFEPDHYYLFPRGGLKAALPGWEILAESHDTFPAPNETVKVFDTVIARKPAS